MTKIVPPSPQWMAKIVLSSPLRMAKIVPPSSLWTVEIYLIEWLRLCLHLQYGWLRLCLHLHYGQWRSNWSYGQDRASRTFYTNILEHSSAFQKGSRSFWKIPECSIILRKHNPWHRPGLQDGGLKAHLGKNLIFPQSLSLPHFTCTSTLMSSQVECEPSFLITMHPEVFRSCALRMDDLDATAYKCTSYET